MRRVYAIGETVLDIIFKDGVVRDSKPGGSMLNCAVSLGRAGLDVSLITEFASDQVGLHVKDFLESNGVNCRHAYLYDQGKTSLALAFLDENNDASYVFYKSYPENRLDLDMPDFSENDIVVFGSFFGIDAEIRTRVLDIITNARDKGCLIIYDPNFRKPHAHELPKLLPYVLENMALADIVRGSNEDFDLLFSAHSIQEVRRHIGSKPDILIMTKSSSGVFLDSASLNSSFPVKKIAPVSTIGAGDNFNAGIIFGLIRLGADKRNIHKLNQESWQLIIEFGVDFASDVCMSYENYISLPYASKLMVPTANSQQPTAKF